VFVIHQLKVKLYTSNSDYMLKGKGKEHIVYDLGQPVPLCGDIKIEVTHKTVVKKVINLELYRFTFTIAHFCGSSTLARMDVWPKTY